MQRSVRSTEPHLTQCIGALDRDAVASATLGSMKSAVSEFCF